MKRFRTMLMLVLSICLVIVSNNLVFASGTTTSTTTTTTSTTTTTTPPQTTICNSLLASPPVVSDPPQPVTLKDCLQLEEFVQHGFSYNAVKWCGDLVDNSCFQFRRGDVNNDGVYNSVDTQAILNYLKSGTLPVNCPLAADVNNDNKLDISD